MGLDRPIDITADQRKTVLALLARHLPNTTAWVYGSRVKWTARPESDLDLVVFAGPEQSGRVSDLREAFEESNLPFQVDLFIWDEVPEQFRKHIGAEHVVLVEKKDSGLPSEWREIPFSEAVLVNPTVRLDRGVTYPFVDMAGVNADSRSAFPSEQRKFRGGGSRFHSGDTLMARITPCLENGKIARYRVPEPMLDAHGSTEFIVIRGRPNVTDNDFAYYLTQWNEVREYAIGQMTGTSGRQRVPVSSLDHLVVPIPSLPEQRSIAHTLGTLDDKIELNRRMNQTLEEMARALFKSWFVDFDPVRAKATLKHHAATLPQGGSDWSVERARAYLDRMDPNIAALFPDRFVDSELGPIPAGWEVGTLGSLAVVSSGKRPSIRYPTTSSRASIPLWGGNGPMAFVPEALVDYPILLTGRVGTLGSVFRITAPCYPSDNTLVLRAKCNSSFDYIRFNLEMVDFEALNRGSTQPLLTQGDLKAQPVLLPPVSVLEYFSRCTSCIFNKIDGIACGSRTLAALRDALLPRLVSGGLRVKDTETIAWK